MRWAWRTSRPTAAARTAARTAASATAASGTAASATGAAASATRAGATAAGAAAAGATGAAGGAITASPGGERRTRRRYDGPPAWYPDGRVHPGAVHDHARPDREAERAAEDGRGAPGRPAKGVEEGDRGALPGDRRVARPGSGRRRPHDGAVGD